jgi:hypothetical protein
MTLRFWPKKIIDDVPFIEMVTGQVMQMSGKSKALFSTHLV